MKHLTVAAYMNSPVCTIQKDMTVREVVQLMIDKKTNGLVIVDHQEHVVGILSSWDIIKHIVPDYLEDDEHLAGFEAPRVFADRIIKIADDPVEKFMTDCVHSIEQDATLIEAAALLAKFHIRQMPVVDKNNVLIGYLNRTDIKLAAGDILKEVTQSKK